MVGLIIKVTKKDILDISQLKFSVGQTEIIKTNYLNL